MKRLLLLAVISGTLLTGLGAGACEKHLRGHNNSADSAAESSNR